MKFLIIFLIAVVSLTPTICANEITAEQLKIAHEFAKIFIESYIPMYIRMNLREKLIKSIFDPPIMNKFKFKDCEGNEYNLDEFVDNYLLAGKLGDNVTIDEKGYVGRYNRQGHDFFPTYSTRFRTSLRSYNVMITLSIATSNLQFYTISANC
ncbi:unnamed protein product [Caenorhabditis angaria]|uniref:Uncharacterized protein n=1 Tax=Caenorhabditis angaria TaxID=860376 RepID=A0A9P1ID75_9PELO|nr:unnamed protein product [Caenorhabditis angaria]